MMEKQDESLDDEDESEYETIVYCKISQDGGPETSRVTPIKPHEASEFRRESA